MTTLAHTVALVADDPVPEDEDVVAGGWGALTFVFLIAATVFLAFSFTKQLRKAQAARDAGVYGDEPVSDDATERADEPTSPESADD